MGLVNEPVKFDTKWLFKFETDYQRLFESKACQVNDTLRDSVGAKIILMSTPYILYEQFKSDDNYRTYREGIMISMFLEQEFNGHHTKKVMKWSTGDSLEQSILKHQPGSFFSRFFVGLRLKQKT